MSARNDEFFRSGEMNSLSYFKSVADGLHDRKGLQRVESLSTGRQYSAIIVGSEGVEGLRGVSEAADFAFGKEQVKGVLLPLGGWQVEGLDGGRWVLLFEPVEEFLDERVLAKGRLAEEEAKALASDLIDFFNSRGVSIKSSEVARTGRGWGVFCFGGGNWKGRRAGREVEGLRGLLPEVSSDKSEALKLQRVIFAGTERIVSPNQSKDEAARRKIDALEAANLALRVELGTARATDAAREAEIRKLATQVAEASFRAAQLTSAVAQLSPKFEYFANPSTPNPSTPQPKVSQHKPPLFSPQLKVPPLRPPFLIQYLPIPGVSDTDPASCARPTDFLSSR